jgi:dTDP-4-amino-4,6-dideoxygalactose transaminase
MSERAIAWWRTSFGESEIQRVRQSVLNEHISQGPVTAEFEQAMAEALQVSYAIATTSGSVALAMSLLALGVGPGAEVIVPNRTWIATAHAVLLVGAKITLVDVLPDVPVLDVAKIREKITDRTKAIIPVHLNGRAVNMESLKDVAREFGLVVVEDACQALFSRNKSGFLGTQSQAGCFSLGVTKLLSTGQGGLIVTQDSHLNEKLRLIRNNGVVDIFTDTWNQFGFNFKFTDIQASFGLAQLQRVQHRIDRLHAIYQQYADGLNGLEFLHLLRSNVVGGELPLYVEVQCPNRNRLTEFLKSHNIQARPLPPNLNTSSYLDGAGVFPNSDRFAGAALYLPCGPEQPSGNVERVLEVLRQYQP